MDYNGGCEVTARVNQDCIILNKDGVSLFIEKEVFPQALEVFKFLYAIDAGPMEIELLTNLFRRIEWQLDR